jgi:hypothetical protein
MTLKLSRACSVIPRVLSYGVDGDKLLPSRTDCPFPALDVQLFYPMNDELFLQDTPRRKTSKLNEFLCFVVVWRFGSDEEFRANEICFNSSPFAIALIDCDCARMR